MINVFYPFVRVWVRENQEGTKKISFKSRVFDFPYGILLERERVNLFLLDKVVSVRCKYLLDLVNFNVSFQGVEVVSVNESCIREFELI
jgi:hypothetical protein